MALVSNVETVFSTAQAATLKVVGGTNPNSPTTSTPRYAPKNIPLEVEKSLTKHLQERKGLAHFYNDLKPTSEHIQTATSMVNKLWERGIGTEISLQLIWLVLYDMALLLDDSISMGFEENARRVEVLKQTVKTIAGIFSFSRQSEKEGITSVRFLNEKRRFARNLRPNQVNGLFKGINFQGMTRIGTELNERVLRKYDIKSAKRPLIVIVITDGEVEGEDPEFLQKVIHSCAKNLVDYTKNPRGAHAISYQFASVGDDIGVESLLRKLDDDKTLGDYIDCMEVQSLEVLTQEITAAKLKWVVTAKLLLGAISDEYDNFKLFASPCEQNDVELVASGHNDDSEVEFVPDEEGGNDDW